MPHTSPPATNAGPRAAHEHPRGMPPLPLAHDPLARILLITFVNHWRTLLFSLAFAFSAAALYLHRATPLYQATATLELSARRPRILSQQAAVIEDPTSSGNATEDILNTRIEKLRAQPLLQAAAAELRSRHPELQLQDDEALLLFEERLSIAPLRRTRLVRVHCTHPNPATAQAACNVFAAVAEAATREEYRTSSDAAVQWLGAQATSQKEELEKAEAALLDFQREHPLGLLSQQRTTMEETTLRQLTEARNIAETRAVAERNILQTVTMLTSAGAAQLPSGIARLDELNAVLKLLSTTLAEREILLAKYTAKHPVVLAKDQALQAYQRQLDAVVARVKATTAANVAALDAQIRDLQQKIDEAEAQTADLGMRLASGQAGLASLERARQVSEQSYRGILVRIQEARMAADETTATLALVESATLPTAPVYPRPVRTLALAILLGCGGAALLVMARELLADRVENARELESSLGIQVLASTPHLRKVRRSDIALASVTHELPLITESFANLRAILDSAMHAAHSHVVLVTSSVPAEGKTVTACNLAGAWANCGRRVLLLDLDLRRPTLSDVFPAADGLLTLNEVLQEPDEPASFLHAAHPTKNPNLSVMLCRKGIADVAAEIVGGQRLQHVIEWARAHYEHVVIDAPPLLGFLGDAVMLSSFVDMTLVVARPATSRLRWSRDTVQRLRAAGVSHLAAVLNDVRLSRRPYGSGPSYRYYRHYYGPASGKRAKP